MVAGVPSDGGLKSRRALLEFAPEMYGPVRAGSDAAQFVNPIEIPYRSFALTEGQSESTVVRRGTGGEWCSIAFKRW